MSLKMGMTQSIADFDQFTRQLPKTLVLGELSFRLLHRRPGRYHPRHGLSLELSGKRPAGPMARRVFAGAMATRFTTLPKPADQWGDESWRDAAYSDQGNLFNWPEKVDNETIAEGFRVRLQKHAGFDYVPRPIPMRNQRGAVVYFLFFGSSKPVAARIVESIFRKYETKGILSG